MRKKLLAFCGLAMAISCLSAVSLLHAHAEVTTTGYVYQAGESVDVTDVAKIYEYDGSGVGDNNGTKHRYADNAQYFTYKAHFDVDSTAYAYMTLYASSNRSVKISSDNTTWEEVHYSVCEGTSTSVEVYSDSDVVESLGSEDNGQRLKLAFALSEYLANDGSVYIRIGAHNASYGWGGDLYALSFREMGKAVINVESGGEKSVDLSDATLCSDISGTGLGESNGTPHRYADTTQYFEYKVKYDSKEGSGKYIKIFYKGTNRALSVSADGETYTVIGRAGSDDKAAYSTGNDARGYYCFYDLSDYISADGEVFVRFGAMDTASGNGADVFSITFLDGYTDENFGQSDASGIDLKNSDAFVESVTVTDFGKLTENSGAGLLPYNGKLALSTKNTDYFVYKLDVPANADASRSYIRVEMAGSTNLIEASKDGETYTELGKPGSSVHKAVIADGNVFYYSLTPYINGNESVYLRFSSSEKKTDGGEAFLMSLTAFVSRTYETDIMLPEHYDIDVTHVDAGPKEENFLQTDLSRFDNPDNMDDAGYRYFDEESYGVYKVEYDSAATALALVMDIRGGYRISVSSDGMIWKDVLLGEALYARAQSSLPKDFLWANITTLVEKNGTLYIKVADATTDGGWGGAFTRLSVMSVVEVSESAEIVPALIPQGKLNAAIALYDPRLLEAESKTSNAYLGRKVVENGYFSYKFDLPTDARSFYIAMRQNGELNVRVSSDGQNFSTIPNEYILNETNGYGSMLTYNLAYMLEQSKTVYVRFDNINANNEGILYSLYAGYNVTENAGKEYKDRTVEGFLSNDVSEEKYLFEYDDTQVGKTNKYKEYNRTSYGVYKFNVKEGSTAVKLIASIGNSFVLSVSADNKNWTDVIISDQQYYGNNHLSDDTVRDVYLDITHLVNGQTLYVKVTDLIDDNDCGAQLRGLGIVSMSGEEVTENDVNVGDSSNESNSEGGNNDGCASSLTLGSMLCMAALGVLSVAMWKKKD